MDIIEKIISNFKNNKSLYIGEKVTIAEHMIQSQQTSAHVYSTVEIDMTNILLFKVNYSQLYNENIQKNL